MAAPKKSFAGKVNVETDVQERGGIVMVQAVAPQNRINDSRPIAGAYLKRRYHDEKFLIRSPEQFSITWMRFVDEPPASWVEFLTKRWESHANMLNANRQEWDPQTEPTTMDEAMLPPDLSHLTPMQREALANRKRNEQAAMMSMNDIAEQARTPNEINTSTGQVQPRPRRGTES